MTPEVVLILIALGCGGFWFWKSRAKFHSALSATLFTILDAIVVGYIIYLVVAAVFDFGAFKEWSGAARLLFFYGKPTGGQYFAMFVGAALGYLRIFQHSGGQHQENTIVYRGGRKIWCHKSALRYANSLLAARADELKLGCPRHLDKTKRYTIPANEAELDVIEALEDAESNLALTPYEPEKGEYDTVSWGMIRIPIKETENHFLAVGATGSGKTLMIHSLMKSVLPRIKTQNNFRAFVYDDKPDFLAFASDIEVQEYVWNFDPFDKNGIAWDIAADVTSYAEAQQVASVLAPVDDGLKEPFFQQAVQGILSAVFISFLECSGSDWTLRDVLLSFSSQERLNKILKRHPASYRIAQSFLGAKKSFTEVMASARTKLGPYEIPAALWSGKEKKSMREWHEQNAIAVVRSREIFSQAVKPINQALFRMASLLLLNQDDSIEHSHREDSSEHSCQEGSNERSCWIFLDEIREIGRLEGYHALANKGRSKGVRLVLGFQSIAGMRAEHKDENAADEIAEICGNRTFLHLDCVKTREWAAKHMGNIVVDETVFTHSRNYSKDGVSSGISWQTKRESRASMESSDFNQNLKKATPENGIVALNTVPFVGTYLSAVPWSWVLNNFPRKKHTPEELLGAEQQKILEWNHVDLKRLRLPADFLEEENGKEEGGGAPKASPPPNELPKRSDIERGRQ